MGSDPDLLNKIQKHRGVNGIASTYGNILQLQRRPENLNKTMIEESSLFDPESSSHRALNIPLMTIPSAVVLPDLTQKGPHNPQYINTTTDNTVEPKSQMTDRHLLPK